jgi:methanogenic corrinoid protein MtbC1
MIEKEVYNDYLNNLTSGQRSKLSDVVHRLINSGMPIPDLYENLIRRSMYQVGELWEMNKVSVATEHMATAITEGLLNQIYPQLIRKESIGKTALIGSVEGEPHQVGAKMVCDILEMAGWESYFLGANTPTSELIIFIHENKPDLIGLSMSSYFNMMGLKKMIKAIHSEFVDIPIIIGGQGLLTNGKEIAAQTLGVHHVKDLAELNAYLDDFL